MTARAIVLLERDGIDVVRWTAAAGVVLAAHLGLMASYLMFFSQQPQGVPDTPAVIVDLAPMPVAPESPIDMASGPPMAEAQSVPEPQVAERPPPEPIIELPPPIEKPVVALPEPPPPLPREVKEEPKPEEKPPEPKRVERKPAPRTAAPPRSDRNTAETPAAPNTGASAARADWSQLVSSQLRRAQRYPSGPASRREQGLVMLSFTLNRSGVVLGRRIARSSGNSELDKEALEMVQRAAPFPSAPPEVKEASSNFTVPIHFSLR